MKGLAKLWKKTRATVAAYKAYKGAGYEHKAALDMIRAGQLEQPKQGTGRKPPVDYEYIPPEGHQFEPTTSDFAQCVVGSMEADLEGTCKIYGIDKSCGVLMLDINRRMPELKERVSKAWVWMMRNKHIADSNIKRRFYDFMVEYETDVFLFSGLMRDVRERKKMKPFFEEMIG